MRRLLFFALFPLMLLIVNPLQESTTALREYWEGLS